MATPDSILSEYIFCIIANHQHDGFHIEKEKIILYAYRASICIICGNALVTQGAGELTHCSLVTPYGDKDLGQHWLG